MRWQMALYKEMSGKAEDSNNPEKIVKRVQEVSAVLYHLEQVLGAVRMGNGGFLGRYLPSKMPVLFKVPSPRVLCPQPIL